MSEEQRMGSFNLCSVRASEAGLIPCGRGGAWYEGPSVLLSMAPSDGSVCKCFIYL